MIMCKYRDKEKENEKRGEHEREREREREMHSCVPLEQSTDTGSKVNIFYTSTMVPVSAHMAYYICLAVTHTDKVSFPNNV